MTTQALPRNLIGFRSGMHKSCTAYAAAAFALRPTPTIVPQVQAPAETDHSLAAHQILALPDKDLSVTCLAGQLWLTREGDAEDYILGAGQSLDVRRGERAIVQAIKDARVRLLAA